MSGQSLHDRLVEALDRCAKEQAQMAQRFASELRSGENIILQNELNRLMDLQLARLIDLVVDDAQGLSYAREVCADHPYFTDYLSQAGLPVSRRIASLQFSVDLDLLRAVSEAQDLAGTPYAIALRRYMLGLPSAESLRQSQRGLAAMLGSLPRDSQVLALDCGPALEVQSVLKQGPLTFSLDLFDRCTRTLDYLLEQVRDPRIRYVACNPLEMLTGRRRFPLHPSHTDEDGEQAKGAGAQLELASSHYDLVYVRGLYNYVTTHQANPLRGVTGLTSVLFDLVKPGGRLVIGNCLTPGAANPHTAGALFFLEVFANWHLVYRSASEIVAFAANLPNYAYHASLLDETLSKPLAPDSVMGFLVLDRLV